MRISGRRRSPRRTCGARTRPRTRASCLRVFGTEQGLRYRIPFREVDEVIDYLRAHATEDGERVGTMGDDGEKFGAWPTTWEHCWGEGRWVDRFFEALEANADWLTTTTPVGLARGAPPIGRVYVPTGSYAEMGEWALPPDESRVFADRPPRRPGRGPARGALAARRVWRNFQVRYREINDLHKQMLRTSDAVAAMPGGPDRALALDHLYRGQSNDCYWHGLFGGHLHRPHAARDVRAPDRGRGPGGHRGRHARRRRASRPRSGRARRRPAGGRRARSSRSTWTRAPGSAAGTSGRSGTRLPRSSAAGPEAYHETLREQEAAMAVECRPSDDLGPRRRPDGGPASIHERLATRSRVSPHGSTTTPYERRSGLVRFLAPATRRRTRGRRPRPSSSVTRSRRVRDRSARSRSGWSRPGGAVRTPSGDCRGRRHQDDRPRRRPPLPDPGPDGRPSRTDRRRSTRGSGIEWTLTMLGGGANPRPGGRWTARGAATTAAGGATALTTHRPGQRLGRDRRRDDARRAGGRMVGAGRDGLELRGRLRARLPGRGTAAVVAAPAGGRGHTDRHDPSGRDDGPRSRGSSESRPQPAACAPRAGTT